MTRRQRLAQRPRFTAPGRASNWEMANLRADGVWRDTRWTVPWASLADPFHPRSRDDWRTYQQTQEKEDDDDGDSHRHSPIPNAP